ncbi:MAG TPA: cytochrome c peroxidase [Polyangiaceae bacterium]|nr:cytochrome c peroxidase [Polyangiaceae bacterium]
MLRSAKKPSQNLLFRWMFCLSLLAGLSACGNGSSGEPKGRPADAGAQDAGNDAELATLRSMALEEGLPAPGDPTNALLADSAKLPLAQALGHRVFFDKRFSGPLLDADHKPTVSGALGTPGETGKIACASCHVPASGFLDSRSPRSALSLGAGWTPRRAISLLNVSFGRLFMWDGRHDALWNQIFTPLEKHFEMNSGRLYVAQQLARDATYRQAYEQLFGALPPVLDVAQYPQVQEPGCQSETQGEPSDCHGKPGDGAEYDQLSAEKKDAVTRVVVNIGKAIQSFERQLRCGPSRFDAWINGDETALSAEEQRGARLFVGKAECVRCHSGKFFTDFGFHNVGLEPGGSQELFMIPNDPGASDGVEELQSSTFNATSSFSDDPSVRRFPDSIPPEYIGAFKTSSLRCASRRTSFLHTAQYVSLDDVVSFKNRGGHASGYAGVSELSPLGLSDEEQADLVAFLKSLEELPGTGTQEKWLTPPP